MRTGFTVSLIAHGALMSLALISLNGAEPLQPMDVEAVAVDLVPVEEFASIRAGSERSKVIDTPAPSIVETPKPAELAQPTGTTEEDQPKPLPADRPTPAPTTQTAPEPQPTPQPEPEPVPEPEPAPQPEPAPEPEPKPTPAPTPEPVLQTEPKPADTPTDPAPMPVLRTAALDQRRADYKKRKAAEDAEAERKRKQADERAKPADEISDIINTERSRGATTGQGGQQSAGKPTGQAARLSNSELGVLIAQMRRCWNPGMDERTKGVVITLKVALSQSGDVSGAPQILTDTSGDASLGLSARTAARKVQNCGPFKLPPEKYDTWKDIEVTLDASQAD